MSTWDRRRLRVAAATILDAVVASAEPGALVSRKLRRRGATIVVAGRSIPVAPGRVAVVAVGKAAPAMCRAAVAALGDFAGAVLCIAPSAAIVPAGARLLAAGHPLPDRRGLAAAREVEALATRLGRDDVLLLLLSGGASALLPAPAGHVTLADKAAVTDALLRAGASIAELNTVRRHLSRLKGAGLARLAAPARVACLALSDVVGDDPATIGSGPAASDPTTFADALRVLRIRGLARAAPARVRRHLEQGASGALPETVKPGDPLLRRVTLDIVGNNTLVVDAAARAARAAGLRPVVLTSTLQGEAREAGRTLATILRECADRGRPVAPPACLIAGGETTVTVRGRGQGGRNQELAVAAAGVLEGASRHTVVACLATDGVDGSGGAAGGVVDDMTTRRARALGLPPASDFLDANDSRRYLQELDDLVCTGPTGTNLLDVVLLLAGDRVQDRIRRL